MCARIAPSSSFIGFIQMLMRGKNTAIILVPLCLILIWGASWPVNKVALNYASPEVFSFLRIVFGILGLCIINLFSENKIVDPSFVGFGKYPLIYLFLGVFQIAFFVIFINIGLVYINSGIAAILAYTSPFFIYPIATFVLKENKFLSFQTLGFFIGLVGIIVIVTSVANESDFKGIAFLLLASVSASCSIIFTKVVSMKKNIDIKKSIFQQLIVALLIVMIWNALNFSNLFLDINWQLFLCALYCGFFATGLGFVMMIYIVQNISSYKAGYILIGVPILGYTLSCLVFNISVSDSTEVAILLVVVGLLCSARR